MIAAYTLAKSEVQDGAFKGNRLQLMPNQQASLWTDYTWHNGVLDGFGVGGGVRYTGNTYGDQANTELGKADAYTVFDAAVHYDLGRLDNSLKGLTVAERDQPVRQGLHLDLRRFLLLLRRPTQCRRQR